MFDITLLILSGILEACEDELFSSFSSLICSCYCIYSDGCLGKLVADGFLIISKIYSVDTRWTPALSLRLIWYSWLLIFSEAPHSISMIEFDFISLPFYGVCCKFDIVYMRLASMIWSDILIKLFFMRKWYYCYYVRLLIFSAYYPLEGMFIRDFDRPDVP